ncbi:MAG: VCBS repeat-containing protein, partial [bacterium]|nr:VCBS repeat-containing protein [bacterium]
FNGDGKTDIAIAFDHYQDNLLHVRTLISNGDGTWQVKPEQIVPWGLMCTDEKNMLVKDFNGDGKTDIAIAFDHYQDNLLHVRTLISNGDGTWQVKPEQIVPWGLMCTDEKKMLVDDFNGDGKTDIVIAFDHYQDNLLHVRTLISNGDGTWQVKPEQITPWGKMCTDEKKILVKDFDGDGKTDIAFAFDYYQDNMFQVRTLISNGDGTWQVKPVHYTPWGFMCTDEKEMFANDFSGDGKTDIVAAYYNPSNFYQLDIKTLVSNGDGTWENNQQTLPRW